MAKDLSFYLKYIIIFSIAFILKDLTADSINENKGQTYYEEALDLAGQTEYKKAESTFLEARKEFLKNEDKEKAYQSLLKSRRMHRVTLQYPYSEEEMRKILKENYPDVSDDEREAWIKDGKVDFLQMGNEKLYFEDFVKNVAFRNIPLIQRYSDMKGQNDPFFDEARDIIFNSPLSGYPAKAWQPYNNPIKYMLEASLNIPREKLPINGILKLWIPVPIQTAAQFDVRLVSLTPEKYIKMPAQLDSDIGIVYCEVDMENLKDDLDIKLKAIFSRYTEKFIIDPEKVGDYDKENFIYKRYTSSQKNIPVNEEFRQKALDIVGLEQNPYLAAKKIYEYILENIRYSFMPHVTLDALDIPEPVFVMQNFYGDCGAQSMYFASLCRSIGIPARASGGMQLFPGIEGDHFWAEFYLPNYGWVPVDTTIAESSDWTTQITDEERKAFKDFYFGNLDPYRMVIQNDVDIPLNPIPQEKPILSCAIQFPVVICETTEEDLSEDMDKYWKINFNVIN
ncbi:MAG: transglutaminase domain-containing protein [Candidatus Omnitrophica bacterium]|nr:transglutaminase domain-containing protein [Candidatus Omnitrophota bacterium]